MANPRDDEDPGSQDSTHVDDLPGMDEDEDQSTSTTSTAELDTGARYAEEDDLYEDELLDFELEDVDEDVTAHTGPGRPHDPRP
jgi:hypothetical protein